MSTPNTCLDLFHLFNRFKEKKNPSNVRCIKAVKFGDDYVLSKTKPYNPIGTYNSCPVYLGIVFSVYGIT
jgi:hypothetical protein